MIITCGTCACGVFKGKIYGKLSRKQFARITLLVRTLVIDG